MTQIRKKISSLISSICSVMLSFLGFSCSSPEKEILDMYGCPIADFEIKGAVTTEDGKKVDNAEVRVTYPENSSGIFSIQTDQTDQEGTYNLSGNSVPSDKLKVVCVPADPTLEADSVNVEMKYSKTNYSGDNLWYRGKAEATVNFILKQNQQQDPED